MRIVPDSASLREGNDAHEPKGTPDRNNDGKGDGGQFAKKEAAQGAGAAGTNPVGDITARNGRWGGEPAADDAWGQGARWYYFPPEQGAFTAHRVASIALRDLGPTLDRLSFSKGAESVAAHLKTLAPEPPEGYEIVYRIGGKKGELAGYNAANATGLTAFLDQMTDDGDTTIEWGFQLAKYPSYLNVYVAKIYQRSKDAYFGGFKRGGWGR
jgi:hypothetical protein